MLKKKKKKQSKKKGGHGSSLRGSTTVTGEVTTESQHNSRAQTPSAPTARPVPGQSAGCSQSNESHPPGTSSCWMQQEAQNRHKSFSSENQQLQTVHADKIQQWLHRWAKTLRPSRSKVWMMLGGKWTLGFCSQWAHPNSASTVPSLVP